VQVGDAESRLLAADEDLVPGAGRVANPEVPQDLLGEAALGQVLARFPGLFDGEAMRRARTLRAFDDVVTAPLHGFRDTDDYWTRASSKPVLPRIRVPTLLLNARNDPFMPAASLPGPSEVSAAVRVDFPEEGGHAAFVSGPFPGDIDWMPRRVTAFFEETMG